MKQARIVILSVIAGCTLATIFFATYKILAPPPPIDVFGGGEILVMSTPGGWLEVSTIKSTEVFDSAVDHDPFWIYLGQTFTRIRVPAYYTYRIRLAREWKVLRKDDEFTVVVPKVEPLLPVAVDLARMEKHAAGIWSLLTGPAALNQLEKQITGKLAKRAASPYYIQLQRETARKTTTEFVKKWLVAQPKWRDFSGRRVRVLFADESIDSLGPVAFPLYQPPPR
jgi:hypothetical protein